MNKYYYWYTYYRYFFTISLTEPQSPFEVWHWDLASFFPNYLICILQDVEPTEDGVHTNFTDLWYPVLLAVFIILLRQYLERIAIFTQLLFVKLTGRLYNLELVYSRASSSLKKVVLIFHSFLFLLPPYFLVLTALFLGPYRTIFWLLPHYFLVLTALFPKKWYS